MVEATRASYSSSSSAKSVLSTSIVASSLWFCSTRTSTSPRRSPSSVQLTDWAVKRKANRKKRILWGSWVDGCGWLDRSVLRQTTMRKFWVADEKHKKKRRRKNTELRGTRTHTRCTNNRDGGVECVVRRESGGFAGADGVFRRERTKRKKAQP